MNNLKIVLLLGALSGIFLFVGGMIGGQQGMVMALIFAGAMNLVSYWFSDKIVLKTYGAAELTHNPEGLASALEKLAFYAKQLPMTASQQTAHLFIISPLSGKSMLALFSTHPQIEERVARLCQMRLI